MNADELSTLSPEAALSHLAAGDDALAAGHAPGSVPPELQADLAFLQQLREALHPSSIADLTTISIPAAPPPHLPWTSLGRFQIVRELGRGGMGVVFLAHDPLLDRDVALKVPLAEALADAAARERFQREAQAAAALEHPNVVPVYEAGAVGPVCFLVSAYCPGPTLAE